MSVRIINGRYLYLDFRFADRRYRLPTKLLPTAKNIKFCEDWDATIRHEIALGTFQLEKHFPSMVKRPEAPALRTFKEDAESWLATHKSGWADWTYRKFKNNLDRIYTVVIEKQPFGEKPTHTLKPKDLRILREAIAAMGRKDGKPYTNRSINKFLQPVKGVLLEMFSEGELQTNPIPKKLKLKEKRVEEIDPYSDEELKKLFKTVRRPMFRHYEALTRYIFESGFRPEENYGMQWPNVDLQTLTYKVREVLVLRKLKPPKTEFATRDVEITPGMARWLKAQKARSYLRGPFVWITDKGRPVDASDFAKRVWKPLHDAAEIKYRPPKQARHTWATRHISRGTDPRWMSLQLGTSLEMIFNVYAAQWRRTHDRKASITADRSQIFDERSR